MTAAEYRALGRLMRWARAQGFTYYITTSFGITDWSWSKDGNYAVVAAPQSAGWSVHMDSNRVDMFPASVQELTDVLVALGLLPVEFRSGQDFEYEVRYTPGNGADYSCRAGIFEDLDWAKNTAARYATKYADVRINRRCHGGWQLVEQVMA